MDIYKEIEEMRAQLNRIEELLQAEKGDRKMSVDEAAEYLQISKSHLYKKTHRREIPFHNPGGKILYFFKSELEKYIKNGRVKTAEDIEKEAIHYLMKKS